MCEQILEEGRGFTRPPPLGQPYLSPVLDVETSQGVDAQPRGLQGRGGADAAQPQGHAQREGVQGERLGEISGGTRPPGTQPGGKGPPRGEGDYDRGAPGPVRAQGT